MHTVTLRIGVVLLLVGGACGCVEPFNADVEAPSPRPLVVDGRITSGPGPHTVTLSLAAAFEQSLEGAIDRVGGARVSIVDLDTGRQVPLRETQTGTYETEKRALVGTPGHSYRLEITLADGRRYRSVPAPMPEPVPLDSVFVGFDDTPVPRIKVFATAKDPKTASNFYRWRVRTTREFPIESLNPPFWCWGRETRAPSQVPILDDRLIDGRRIAKQLVFSIQPGFKASRLNQVDVRQLTITKDAHGFWSKVEEQVEEADDPFSAPPRPIQGNIIPVQDSIDRALGYFEVAGASQRSTVCFRQSKIEGTPPATPPTSGCPPVNSPSGSATFDRPAHWICSTNQN